MKAKNAFLVCTDKLNLRGYPARSTLQIYQKENKKEKNAKEFWIFLSHCVI